MLLQPILENAVKYGIELSDIKKSDKAGKITLSSSLIDKDLQIRISSPYHQSLNSQQQGPFEVGLQSTKDRLKHLYQEQAKITLDNSDTDTVTLKITLPAQQIEQIHGINT
jgi:sensor histidine kinase YesM